MRTLWNTTLAMTLLALTLPTEGLAQASWTSQPIKDRYIVQFKESVSRPDIEAFNLVRAARGELHFTYTTAIKGFAATLSAEGVNALRRNPNVLTIEQDSMVSIEATQSGATWGLDRIDQVSLPLNGSYIYNDTAGAGVRVYIIDTGILATHTEFGSRVLVGEGYTAISDRRGTTDCNGHGTHVAGTVGGKTYGVAKAVSLVPVRVLDCRGSGTNSGVIKGVDFVAAVNLPAKIANMSLGGGVSTLLDTAVANAVAKGVTIVVAAGNSNADACTSSPARTPSAITVGAATSSDARASFSNFGACLDIFAPGTSITSAWFKSTTSINTISGTSMAAPHVAGVAALVLAQNISLTTAQVTNAILTKATYGVITSAGAGSPNKLLYSQ